MSLLKTSMTHTLNSTTITLPILSVSAPHSTPLTLSFPLTLLLFLHPLIRTSLTLPSCPPDLTHLFWLQMSTDLHIMEVRSLIRHMYSMFVVVCFNGLTIQCGKVHVKMKNLYFNWLCYVCMKKWWGTLNVPHPVSWKPSQYWPC